MRRLVSFAVAAGLAFAGCGDERTAHPSPGSAPDRPRAGPQGAVGQFAVNCAWSHSSFDDPIVHPGHAGVSHRHDFFGNTTTNADSTYDELTAGGTTCQQRLDTASYWSPSLLDADGIPVRPLGSTAYYRAGEGVDPETVEPYPAGLMMVGGDAVADSAQPTSVVAWSCGAGGRREPEPPDCPDDLGPRVLVTFPDCWDGAHLDSDDHRTHVAYSHAGECPGTHPTPIPQLQFAIDYPPIDPDGLSLASGDIRTAHADFWNTWDQAKLETEVDLCLREQNVCGLG